VGFKKDAMKLAKAKEKNKYFANFHCVLAVLFYIKFFNVLKS